MKLPRDDYPDLHEFIGALGGKWINGGTEVRCFCPAHNDTKNPNLDVTIEDGKVLYVCRAGCKNDSVTEALIERGLWPDFSNRNPRDSFENSSSRILDAAVAFWQSKTPDSLYSFIFRTWGIGKELAREMCICWSPGWGLKKALLKTFSEQEIDESGLFYSYEGQQKESLSSRIILPFLRGSKVVYLSGRAIRPEEEPPEGLYSRDTGPKYKHLSLKGGKYKKPLYYAPGNRDLVVCEGFFDVLALQQSHTCGAVGIVGTHVSDEMLDELVGLKMHYAGELYLAMDGDRAGVEATSNIAKVLVQRGILPKIISLPSGEDPASYLKENAKEKVERLLEEAKCWSSLQIEALPEELGGAGREARLLWETISECDALAQGHIKDQLKKNLKGKGAGTEYLREVFTRKESASNGQEEKVSRNRQNRQEPAPYLATSKGIFWLKSTRNDDVVKVQLTNFSVKIINDIIRDDGIDTTRTFELEGHLKGQKVNITLDADDFSKMHWPIKELGSDAIIYTGSSFRDRTREAIQLLSGDISKKSMMTYTGWYKMPEHGWIYLHAGGSISENGAVEDISTDLSGVGLQFYDLPDPTDDISELHSAIRDCMDLWDLVPRNVAFPVFCALWRAVLGESPFSIHLVGSTGTGKSEFAALLQQFFGPSMSAKKLPGSWNSTANYLEMQSFHAKDTILVIDDFAPEGTRFDVARQHKQAASLLRAQGNSAGRGRMKSDGSLIQSKAPRGLILSTGEDIPKGRSIRARALILELGPDDMNWNVLTQAQLKASSGVYAQAMSSYLKWIAPQYEQLLSELPQYRIKLRKHVQSTHKRIGDHAVELAIGFQMFLRFANDSQVFSKDESDKLFEELWEVLVQVLKTQESHQSDSDPVILFFELLISALASGEAHIAGSDGSFPFQGQAWGWRERGEEWFSQGVRVGWIEGENVYLDRPASLRVIEKISPGAIEVGGQTLAKRLYERGFLESKEENGRLLVRRRLEGTRRRVLHLHIKNFGLS